jgi:hypothetical protein
MLRVRLATLAAAASLGLVCGCASTSSCPSSNQSFFSRLFHRNRPAECCPVDAGCCEAGCCGLVGGACGGACGCGLPGEGPPLLGDPGVGALPHGGTMELPPGGTVLPPGAGVTPSPMPRIAPQPLAQPFASPP